MKDKNKFSALWLLVVVLVGWPVAKSRGQTNPPALQIISSNAVATVLWTNHFDTNLVSSSGYYLLQSAGDLSLTAAWTNEVGGDLSVVINSFPATGGSATLTTNLVGGNFAFPIFTTSEQKFYRLRTPPPIPLCCFDIFYNGALEFSLAPPTTRIGRVHANGPVYVGSDRKSVV